MKRFKLIKQAAWCCPSRSGSNSILCRVTSSACRWRETALGLSPRTPVNIRSGVAERRLNGQTGRWPSTAAPRRVTRIPSFRGLKSTDYHQRLAPRGAANREGSRCGGGSTMRRPRRPRFRKTASLSCDLNPLFCWHQQNWSASKTGVIGLTRGMRRTWLEPNPNPQNALAAFVAPF